MLLIDIGNTNIVFGMYQKEKLIFFKRVETKPIKSIEQILEYFPQVSFDEIIVTSVVPEYDETILSISKLTNRKIKFLRYDNCQIRLKGEKSAKQVGSDLLANTIGSSVHGLDASYKLIIDFGTATTFTVVFQNQIEGVMIIPGIKTSLLGLLNDASKLKNQKIIPIRKTNLLLGTNTDDALLCGMYHSVVALANGLIAKIKFEYKNLYVIATGGLGNIIKNDIDIDVYDEYLTLKGLRIFSKCK